MTIAGWLPPRPAWMRRAACRGLPTDRFYPPAGRPAPDDPRRTLCPGCPVRADCLDYAMRCDPREDWGIWGGTTERERRQMRRRQMRRS